MADISQLDSVKPMEGQFTKADLDSMNAATQHLDLDLVEEDFLNVKLENKNGLLEELDDMTFSNNLDNFDEYDIYGERKPLPSEHKPKVKKTTAIPDLESDSLFPSLGSANPKSKGSGWGSKIKTQTISSPITKLATKTEDFLTSTITLKLAQTPLAMNQLRDTLSKVQKKFSVNVNVSSNKLNGSSTFIVKGRPDMVAKAEREIRSGVSPKGTININVPTNVVRFVLGTKGRNLALIQQKTLTNITVPHRDRDEEGEGADSFLEVTITGELSGVYEAKKEIELIIKDKAVKSEIKVNDIPTKYYPFLAGSNNSIASKLGNEFNVELRIPFLAGLTNSELQNKDTAITLVGDKEAINQLKIKLNSLYEELQEEISDLSVSIPKPKHRFLIGPKGTHFKEIFSASGCIVILPEAADPSDKVTVLGPMNKLSQALGIVMDKGMSAQASSLDVYKVNKASEDYLVSLFSYLASSSLIKELETEHGVQIHLPSLSSVHSKIDIVGKSKDQVAKAKAQLESSIKELPPTSFANLAVPFELHGFIRGSDDEKLTAYLNNNDVKVAIPEPSSQSNTITLVSLKNDKKAITQVKSSIEKEIKGFTDIKSHTITAPIKVHRHVIGPNGNAIESIIGKQGECKVVISFGSKPSGNEKRPSYIHSGADGLSNDQILIRGPSSEVDRISQELSKLAVEMEDYEKAKSYITTFTFPSKHSAHVVGKQGSNINRLKDAYDVKIDIDNKSNKDEAQVKIQGIQKNADVVKAEILQFVEKLADQLEDKIRVPVQHHRSIIGQNGRYVKRLEEKYGVFIRFPGNSKDNGEEEEEDNLKSGVNKDEIRIRGGRKGVSEAKAEILEIVEYEKENGHKVTFKVANKFLSHILGRSGSSINEIKDDTNTRIDVDKQGETEVESNITIQGTKQGIKEAQRRIMQIVSEIEQLTTEEIEIPNKFHGYLIGPGGNKLRALVAKSIGLEPNHPDVNPNVVRFPRNKEDTVTVKGHKDIVSKVVQALKEASKQLEEVDTITVEIQPENHATLIGRGGSVLRGIMDKHNVEIQIPKRDTTGPDASKVTISGKIEQCEAAKADLLSRVPVTATITFPQKYHHVLAARSGGLFRKLRSEFQVNVDNPSVPKPTFKSQTESDIARIDDEDTTKVTVEQIHFEEGDNDITWTLKGVDPNLTKAKSFVEKQLAQVQGKDTILRLYAHPSTHRLIVGRGGSTVNQLRADTNCDIELPPSNTARRQDNHPYSDGSAIIIAGTEANVNQAKDKIIDIISSQRQRN